MSPYAWAESKLLPCPFCGSAEIRILPQKPIDPGLKCWTVGCVVCTADKYVVANLQRQVIAEWNHRVKLDYSLIT